MSLLDNLSDEYKLIKLLIRHPKLIEGIDISLLSEKAKETIGKINPTLKSYFEK